MIEDFDVPGLGDLLDLIASLWEALDLDDVGTDDLDQVVVPIWTDAQLPTALPDLNHFWSNFGGPPLDAQGFAEEFGNVGIFNPFAEPTSPIESGSYDDLVAHSAINTGLPLDLFPN